MLIKSKKWVGFDFMYDGHWDNPPREEFESEPDEMKQFYEDFRSDLQTALENAGLKLCSFKPGLFDFRVDISDPEGKRHVYLTVNDMRNETRWESHLKMHAATDSGHLLDDLNWLMRQDAIVSSDACKLSDNMPFEEGMPQVEFQSLWEEFEHNLQDSVDAAGLKLCHISTGIYGYDFNAGILLTASISNQEEKRYVFLSAGDKNMKQNNSNLMVHAMTDTDHLISDLCWLIRRER